LNAVLERFPHRLEPARQCWQGAEVDTTFFGLWKSLPREARRPNSTGGLGVAHGVGSAVAAGDDLDTAAAMRLELGEQRVLLVRGEAVAGGWAMTAMPPCGVIQSTASRSDAQRCGT
jgi:hypothetical protein